MTMSRASLSNRPILGASLAILAAGALFAQPSLADSHAAGAAVGHHPKAQALREKGVDFEFKGDTTRVVRFFDGQAYYGGQGLRRGVPGENFRRRNALPAPAPVVPPTPVE